MINSQYTVKAQLAGEVLSSVFFLLISILDMFYNGKYVNAIFIAYGIVLVGIFIFHSYFKGINDELSSKILAKVNEKSINFIYMIMLIVGLIATTPDVANIFKSIEILGVILMTILLCFTIFRLILFIYYDKKGIFE